MKSYALLVSLGCVSAVQRSACIRMLRSMAEELGIKHMTLMRYQGADLVMTPTLETKESTKNTSIEDLSLGGTMPLVTD